MDDDDLAVRGLTDVELQGFGPVFNRLLEGGKGVLRGQTHRAAVADADRSSMVEKRVSSAWIQGIKEPSWKTAEDYNSNIFG
jgi:hypothetical protein